MLERIAEVLAELTGTPVSSKDIIGMLVILVISAVICIVGAIANKNSKIDYKAVEEDRKRYEKEINGWD